MDDDDELITRLLALVGSIMEDASPIAIIDSGELPLADRIAEIAAAAKHACVLARAAEVVRRRADVGRG